MPVDPAMLDEIPLVANLDREAKASLTLRCTTRTYSQAQEIISKENNARDVYFITSGSARVVNWSSGGREVNFEDIPGGGMFGEMAAIDGAPRSATVVALEPTEVCSIDGASFYVGGSQQPGNLPPPDGKAHRDHPPVDRAYFRSQRLWRKYPHLCRSPAPLEARR